jgi:hypothetical protein
MLLGLMESALHLGSPAIKGDMFVNQLVFRTIFYRKLSIITTSTQSCFGFSGEWCAILEGAPRITKELIFSSYPNIGNY